MTNKQKRKIIREAVKYILDFLKEDDHIIIRGFGTFRVVDRKARKIRNIRTGQIITIPSYTTVKFKASRKLRNYFPSLVSNARSVEAPKKLKSKFQRKKLTKHGKIITVQMSVKRQKRLKNLEK